MIGFSVSLTWEQILTALVLIFIGFIIRWVGERIDDWF